MVQGSEHATSQEHDGGEQHRHGRELGGQQTKTREQDGEDRSGEDLKEALDP
jgi:hypothetical protein